MAYPKQYSWHDISLCITTHPIHICTAFLALVIVRHWVRTLTIIANLRIFALLKTHSTVEPVCHHISWQSESGLESGFPLRDFELVSCFSARERSTYSSSSLLVKSRDNLLIWVGFLLNSIVSSYCRNRGYIHHNVQPS